MSVLITGAGNGLGKFLADQFGVVGFTRQSEFAGIKSEHFDLIVHCAFNTNNSPRQEQLHGYAYDNIVLTHRLLNEVTCDKFVFISSIDVYPTGMNPKNEEFELDINEVNNIYGKTKLMSEDIVACHPNHLILRCGGIIGPTKCPKSIFDIKNTKITSLSKESILSYVPQQAIMDIIDSPTWETGIFNVASDATLCISELEEFYGPIDYGSYTYEAINVPTDKLKIHFPSVKIPPSKETLLDVLQNM